MLRVYQLNVSVCRRRRGGYEFSCFVDVISFFEEELVSKSFLKILSNVGFAQDVLLHRECH